MVVPSLDQLRELRSATYRAAHDELIALLGRPWPDDSLQSIGEGLLAAVHARADGADPLARRCARELEQRDWDGDEELDLALRAVLGEVPPPELRPLPVDLEELAEAMASRDSSEDGRIDLTTGEVLSADLIEAGLDSGDVDFDFDVDEPIDESRWLVIDKDSRAAYRDMADFVADLGDDPFAERLARAIDGRGAFRRFWSTLDQQPVQLTRWNAYSADRRRGRARRWLAEQGYAATRDGRPLIAVADPTPPAEPEPIRIRTFRPEDWPAMWRFMRSVLAEGDTYCWPTDATEEAARAWWTAKPGGLVLVAELDGVVVGTAEIHPNHPAAGDHVANAGFMVAPAAAGQGVGRALATRVLDLAREHGFRAMLFNAVVETNENAIRLWRSLGFEILTTIPAAFRHPRAGLVGLHVMHREL